LECQQYASACHKESGDYNRLAWDLIDVGALHKNLGDLTKARRFIDDGLELSRRVGSPPAEAYGLAHRGSLDLYQGDYSAAETHYRQALDLQKEIHSEHIIATAEAGIGLASFHLGNSVQSRHWLERALQRARSCGHRRRIAETLIQLGLLDIAELCLDVARCHLVEGLSIAQDCESGEGVAAGLAAMARLERNSGDLERALELAIEAVCLAEQTGLTSCEMWGEVEAGLACLALGDVRSALKHTGRATSLAAEASQDWLGPAEAYRAHARVLRAAGQIEEADRLDSCAKNVLYENSLHIIEPRERERYLLKWTVPK
jgi:tetratricopeptide (TPR) repeat protein